MNIFLLMLLSAVVIICSFTNSAIAADSGDLIGGKFTIQSHIVRGEIARDLLGKVQRLSDLLPNPTPSESDWVKQEGVDIEKLDDRSEAKNHRRLRYVESPEFRHVNLHIMFTNILQSLSCAAAPNTSLSMEMYCWSIASFYLTDLEFFNYSIHVLIKSGRLPLPSNIADHSNFGIVLGSKELGYGYWLNTYGRGIHGYIVNPYLNGHIK